MTENLLIIAITSPAHYPYEAQRIIRILRSEMADIVHVRKPEWSAMEVTQLLCDIPQDLRERIKLHDHFQLVEEFRLGGVHLNSRNPVAPPNASSVSCSCHTIEQVEASAHYDYITLSPIFDSISKSGYRSEFTLEELKPIVAARRVVALGGVTPEKFHILRDAGFYGAAMLGYFWPIRNFETL